MKTLVLTLVGKDRPGLINLLSNVVLNHGGNWIDSHFGRLAGQFAGIAEISLPDENYAQLSAALNQLEGVKITLQTGGEQAESQRPIAFLVTANDRPGIIKELTDCLLRLQVNLLQMQTQRSHAPNWGGELFEAKLEAELPATLDEDELQRQLEQLSDDLMIDMEGS